ncbi:MAG: tetratricopeptide repeat protein [Acidobacteriaceae bacterium]
MYTSPIHFRRLFAVALLALGICSLATPSLAQNMTAKDRTALQSAVRDYQNGDAQAAEPVLRAMLQRYPHNAEALESLGLIYAEQKQTTKALPLLESACRAVPASPIVFENLGITYLKLGRNDDAVRVFRRAVVLAPDGRHEAMLGTALMGLRRYAEAAQAFEASSQSDPENRDSRYQWALALFLSGDLRQAAQRIRSVRDLSAQEQALLGDIHEREGQFAEAVDSYRAAVRLNPSQENINALGLEFLRRSVFDAALANYSDGLSRYPSSPRMMLGLALSKYGINDFTGAAGLLSRLLRSDPHNKVYLEMLAHSCTLNMGDPGSVCDAIILYAETHPGDVIAETAAAATLLQRRRDEQDRTLVRALLQRALTTKPQSMDANYLMGVLYQELSLWQASLPFLRKAVQIDPGYGPAHYRMARALFRLGYRADGEKEIERNAQCNRDEQQKTNRELRDLQPLLAAMR